MPPTAPEKIDLKSLASNLAENLKENINNGTLLTVAGVKLHLDKIVEDAGLGTQGIAGMADAVKALVLSSIPASSVFNQNRAEGLNPEVLGMKGISKERALEVKAELALSFMGRADLGDLATRLGVTREFMVAAKGRMDENTKKTMAVATGAGGGFGVPDEFIAEVQRKLVYSSNFRGNVRTWSGVGLKGSIPRETGTVTVSYQGELTTPTVTDAALGELVWGLNKRFTLMSLSNELLRFSPINFVELLSTMFAEQNRVKDDSVFLSGSGSNQPTGLRTIKTGMNTVAQAAANLDYDDLVNIKHALPVQYRNDGSWLMMNNTALKLVAKLRDNDGRPLFLDRGAAPGAIGGPNVPTQTIGFILGLPVIELNSLLDNYGAGSNTTEIWHLNKKAYSIFEGPGMEFQTSDVASDAFTTDKIYARGISYDDGRVNIAEAAAYLSGVK